MKLVSHEECFFKDGSERRMTELSTNCSGRGNQNNESLLHRGISQLIHERSINSAQISHPLFSEAEIKLNLHFLACHEQILLYD